MIIGRVFKGYRHLSMNYPSRTVASAPRPPARSKGNHSPLLRGGDGGGAVYLGAGGRGTEATVLLGGRTV